MKAREAVGWDLADPDLWVVGGDEDVTLSTVETRNYPGINAEQNDYYYYRLVQTQEPPPVWVWDDGSLITGAHRLTAAHQLGITEYPAYIIPVYAPDARIPYRHVRP